MEKEVPTDEQEFEVEFEIEFPEEIEAEIVRLQNDVNNQYACVKVQYLYNRLKNMGPWSLEDFTIETMLELDALHAALVISYGRIFSDGARKVNASKVPIEFRPIHEEIMALRNKRYAHNDLHDTLSFETNFAILDDNKIEVRQTMSSGMVLGAPPEWEPLIEWLSAYLHEQQQKQLRRLSEMTDFEWVSPSGPPPSWITENTPFTDL